CIEPHLRYPPRQLARLRQQPQSRVRISVGVIDRRETDQPMGLAPDETGFVAERYAAGETCPRRIPFAELLSQAPKIVQRHGLVPAQTRIVLPAARTLIDLRGLR